MRRRMLSWLLVLCMVLGMMPTAVFAEETVEITITVGDQSISAEALGSSTEEVLGGSYDCFQAEIPADTGVTITDNVTTGTQFALGSYNGALAGEAETASFTLSAEDIQNSLLTEEQKNQLQPIVAMEDGDWVVITLEDIAAGDKEYIFLKLTQVSEYTVTLPEGTGYTAAACEGSTSPVAAGGSYSFTVSVADGYEGSPEVKANDTLLTAAESVYTIENITADQVVTVEGVTEKVTVISPTVVYSGTDFPYSSYYVASLILDGVAVDYVSGTDIYLNSTTAADASFTLTATAGGSSAGNLGLNWNDVSTNTMTYTGNLTDGTATVKLYAYKASGAGVSRSGTKTFTLHTAAPNNVPTLAAGVQGTAAVTQTAGESFSLDLDTIFLDLDGDALTYYVSIDGGAAEATEAAYSYTNSVAGTYTLVFTATDGKCMAEKYPVHTVNLTLNNSEVTYAVPVTVSDTVEDLSFYADSLAGETLTYGDGNVQVPQNVTTLWWKAGDMTASAPVQSGTSVTLQLLTFASKTAAGDVDPAATVAVTSPNSNAATGSGYTYLLNAASGYTYVVTPSSSTWVAVTMSDQTVSEALAAQVDVEFPLKNACSVTAPAEAQVHVYYQSGYSNGNGKNKEIPMVYSTTNADGTVTRYYAAGSAGYSYTAFYKDRISYAGYFNSVSDVVLSWEGEERTPSYRGAYDTSTTFGERGEDSVLTNVNSNGHLVLNEEFMLRAYRVWQIINSDTTNIMIEPEFNYSASNENITITPYNQRTESTTTASGTSSNNWVYLTPNGSGITYLEIGYDAVHIVDGYSAGSWGGASGQPGNFTWNASDPNRTALIVVQTDGNAASGITFGIQSPSGGWDYEYDTFYFTGSQGSLTMIPTGDVATVSVSHDKGSSYQTLTGTEGTYTVPIITGNNIIKITDSSGKTAFQVVRGKQISYTIANVTEGKEADEAVYPGDTVRVTFNGMHTVCPKISGIFNPGYPNSNKLYYTADGETISQSIGYQYNFHNNVWIEVTVGMADVALTGGYMDTPAAFGQPIGALYQASAVNSSASGATGRNILPDITIDVVEVEDKEPQLVVDATRYVQQKVGFYYDLDLNDVYEDLALDTLTFYVDSGDGWQETEAQFRFAGDTAGTYTMKFKAVDSGNKESAVFTLIVTVEDIPGSWDGTTRTEVIPNASGVYEISNAAQLAWFADQLNTTDSNRSWNAVLTADIYLNNKTWPIIVNNGISGSPYSGTFDGQGHTIYGLLVNSDSKSDGKYLGLFGYVSGTIQNLSVAGSISAPGGYAGGIAGRAKSGARFTNCLANVTVTGLNYLAGLVGNDLGGTYEGCVNLGDITGSDGYIGGVVASYSTSTKLYNCYNRGNVTGTKYVGGLVSVYLSWKPTVQNCYSTGDVSGNTYTGKFAGARYDTNFSNCYYITESVLTGSGGKGGTEVSAATLKTYAATLGESWAEDTDGINNGYPILAWQASAGTEEPVTYTVTLPEGEGYTITATQDSASPVEEGGSYSFTVTVAEGYDASAMVVSANETELTAEDGVYTIQPITADVTIAVTGVVKTYTVTLPEGEGYTITATQDSVSPVKQGGSYSFTITVAKGYDGTNMVVKANDAVLTAENGVYTIENITEDQTITVTGIQRISYADLDGNGIIDALDAAMAYSIANGKLAATEAQRLAADVTGDGTVDALDAAMIYSYANGKITEFPVSTN